MQGCEEFRRFADLLGVEVMPGVVSAPLELASADLSLGWVADRASTEDR